MADTKTFQLHEKNVETKEYPVYREHIEDPYIVTDGTDNEPEAVKSISASTIIAIFVMRMSFVPAISMPLVLPSCILQQIGTDLGDTSTIVWIPGTWSVAPAVSFAIAGEFSDVFGRRWVLIFGQFVRLVGTTISATAGKTTTVIEVSTISGLGAGIVFVGYPGITELLPNKYRGAGIGFTEFCLNVPWNMLSVFLASEFVLHTTEGWRWPYYISIIYSLFCIVGTTILYFPPSHPRHDYHKTRWQQLKSLDFTGLLLFASGLTLLLVGLTYLGLPTYSKALVESTIIIGAIIFITCFIYDFTIPKTPIFPLYLFTMTREFTVHLIVLFVAGMIWQAITTLTPQATLYLFTNKPLEIGIIEIPATMSGVVGGWILPSLLHKIKHVRIQIIVALTIQKVFTAVYAAVVPDNKTAWMILQFFGQACFT